MKQRKWNAKKKATGVVEGRKGKPVAAMSHRRSAKVAKRNSPRCSLAMHSSRRLPQRNHPDNDLILPRKRPKQPGCIISLWRFGTSRKYKGNRASCLKAMGLSDRDEGPCMLPLDFEILRREHQFYTGRLIGRG